MKQTEIQILPFFHFSDSVLLDDLAEHVKHLPKNSTFVFEASENGLALLEMVRLRKPPAEIEKFMHEKSGRQFSYTQILGQISDGFPVYSAAVSAGCRVVPLETAESNKIKLQILVSGDKSSRRYALDKEREDLWIGHLAQTVKKVASPVFLCCGSYHCKTMAELLQANGFRNVRVNTDFFRAEGKAKILQLMNLGHIIRTAIERDDAALVPRIIAVRDRSLTAVKKRFSKRPHPSAVMF